jgi:hypothetical protein
MHPLRIPYVLTHADMIPYSMYAQSFASAVIRPSARVHVTSEAIGSLFEVRLWLNVTGEDQSDESRTRDCVAFRSKDIIGRHRCKAGLSVNPKHQKNKSQDTNHMVYGPQFNKRKKTALPPKPTTQIKKYPIHNPSKKKSEFTRQ